MLAEALVGDDVCLQIKTQGQNPKLCGSGLGFSRGRGGLEGMMIGFLNLEDTANPSSLTSKAKTSCFGLRGRVGTTTGLQRLTLCLGLFSILQHQTKLSIEDEQFQLQSLLLVTKTHIKTHLDPCSVVYYQSFGAQLLQCPRLHVSKAWLSGGYKLACYEWHR